MALQTYLAEDLVPLWQAELLDAAARCAASKHLARSRSILARTGVGRKRIGMIVINVGHRIHGPVVNPPTIARWQGGSSSAPSLRLF